MNFLCSKCIIQRWITQLLCTHLYQLIPATITPTTAAALQPATKAGTDRNKRLTISQKIFLETILTRCQHFTNAEIYSKIVVVSNSFCC